MLIPVLVIGGAGAVIAIAALMSRKPKAQAPVKFDPVPAPPEEDTKRTGDDPPDDEGGGAAKFVDTAKKTVAKLGDWLEAADPDPKPEPPTPGPQPPDPYSPAPAPIAGKYYQVIKGDTLWEMARAAYGSGGHYPRIVSDEKNQWIGVHGTDWGGGLYPKYSGWNTAWKTGYEYPVVYIPVIN